jgi:hypothetical protein
MMALKLEIANIKLVLLWLTVLVSVGISSNSLGLAMTEKGGARNESARSSLVAVWRCILFSVAPALA